MVDERTRAGEGEAASHSGRSHHRTGRTRRRRLVATLRRLLSPPQTHVRPGRRPPELIYGLDDKVPRTALIPLAGQHAMLALTYLIYPLVALSEAHLDPGRIQAVLTACTLCIGITTILQCLPWRFGSGYLGIHVPSPGSIPLAIQSLSLGGPGLMAANTLVLGVLQLLISRIVRPLRVLLPPEVCGVAVTMLGVSLAAPALRRALGMTGGHVSTEGGALLVSGLTLGLIVAVTVFAPRRLKLFAVLAGASVGWATAVLTGIDTTDYAAILGPVEMLDVPELSLPEARIVPALLPLMGLMVMMSVVDVLSTTVSLEKMNDADWRRADMGAASRAVTTVGIGNVLNGLVTGFQASLSSAAVGLAFATGATARIVGVAAGALMVATAFFPKIIVALTLIPSPVIGGILLYTAAYLLVAGMDLILSRRLSDRRVFLVGLSMLAGLSVALLPIHDQLPAWAQPLFSTPLTVAACFAILLNLVFRIGISRETGETVPEEANAFLTVQSFLERQGGVWGARRDVVAAAIPVAAQALEMVRDTGVASGPVELRARFDETHLDVFVLYEGEVMEAPKERPSPEALLGDAKEVAAFAAYMLTRLGDKVTFGRLGHRARITLRFDH